MWKKIQTSGIPTPVVHISVSARATPRAAQTLRRAGYEIKQFEELSEPVPLKGEVITGGQGGRFFLALENTNIIVILDRGIHNMVAIGTRKNRRANRETIHTPNPRL